MIALDTNILVRCLTLDDPHQLPAARAALGLAAGVFVSKTVLLETERVLRAAYKLSRERIHGALMGVCGLPHLQMEHPAQVAQALEDYASGMDFADALHVAASQANEGMRTFDTRFVRAAQAKGRDVRLAALPGVSP